METRSLFLRAEHAADAKNSRCPSSAEPRAWVNPLLANAFFEVKSLNTARASPAMSLVGNIARPHGETAAQFDARDLWTLRYRALPLTPPVDTHETRPERNRPHACAL